MASTARHDPLSRLAGDVGDQVEVMVVVQNRNVMDDGGRRDHHVGGRHPVLPSFGKHPLDFDRILGHFTSDVEPLKTFEVVAIMFELLLVSRRVLNLKRHRKTRRDPVALADLLKGLERGVVHPGLREGGCVNQNQKTAKRPS